MLPYIAVLLVALIGCARDSREAKTMEAPPDVAAVRGSTTPSEPAADNAFTRHIARGQETIEKAKVNVAATNAQIQQQQQSIDSIPQ